MSDETAKAYLQEMIANRGYVLEYHKVMVLEDMPFMKAVNQMLETAYTDERSLSKKVKELLFSVLMTSVGAPKDVIKIHIGLAAKAGATKEEVLEALGACLAALRYAQVFPGSGGVDRGVRGRGARARLAPTVRRGPVAATGDG